MINRDSFAVNFGAETLVGLVMTESHGGSSMVAEHPISSGAPVTDHYRKNVPTYSAQILICDFPIAFFAPLIEQTSISISARKTKMENVPLDVKSAGGIPVDPLGAAFSAIKSAVLGGDPTNIDLPSSSEVKENINATGIGYGGRDFQKEAFDFLERLQDSGGACQVVTPLKTYDRMMLSQFTIGKAKENSYAIIDLNFKGFLLANTKTILVPKVKSPSAAVKKSGQNAAAANANTDQRSSLLRIMGLNPTEY